MIVASRGFRLTVNASTRLWWGSPRTVFVDATDTGLRVRLPRPATLATGSVFTLLAVGESFDVADEAGTVLTEATVGARVRAFLDADGAWRAA